MHYFVLAILIVVAVLIFSVCGCDRKPTTLATGQITGQTVGQNEVKEINDLEKRLAIKLDESLFCKKCRPDAKDPHFAMTVTYPGEDKVYRVEAVTADDIALIAEFLAGKTEHAEDYDAKSPLRTHIPRLEELLNVKAEKCQAGGIKKAREKAPWLF